MCREAEGGAGRWEVGGPEEGRAGYREQLLTRASEGTAPRLSLGGSLAVQFLVSPLALVGSRS